MPTTATFAKMSRARSAKACFFVFTALLLLALLCHEARAFVINFLVNKSPPERGREGKMYNDPNEWKAPAIFALVFVVFAWAAVLFAR